jgi:hypothetical protein
MTSKELEAVTKARVEGRALVKDCETRTHVELIYCNGQALVRIKIPLAKYSYRKIKELWDNYALTR